jgi:hypothetical protein
VTLVLLQLSVQWDPDVSDTGSVAETPVASTKRGTPQVVELVANNRFCGLHTDASTGEVSFSVRVNALTSELGGPVVLRARAASSKDIAAKSVAEAISQPFRIV